MPGLDIISIFAADQKLRLPVVKHPDLGCSHIIQVPHSSVLDLTAHAGYIVFVFFIKPDTVPLDIIAIGHQIFVDVLWIAGVTLSKA